MLLHMSIVLSFFLLLSQLLEKEYSKKKEKRNETIFPLVLGFCLQLTLFSNISNRFPWRKKVIFCPEHNRNHTEAEALLALCENHHVDYISQKLNTGVGAAVSLCFLTISPTTFIFSSGEKQ